MRLTAAVLLLCSVALTACASGTGTPADAGCTGPGCPCSTARDCSQTTPQVCVGGTTKVCVIVCSKSSDCSNGNVCEDGSCTSPGCGGPSDCAGGQICTNGSCGSQVSTVGSCVITPNPAVVHAGAKLNFLALVKDGSGNTVPFSPIAWSTSSGTIDNAGVLTAAAPSAGATGTTTVKATAGGQTCTSTVTTYAAATDPLRVVVVDAHTKKPVAGAFVVIGSGPWTTDTKKTTDASGVAIFANAGASPRDVHAFAADHNYASYIGVGGADLLITLQPYVALSNRSGFKGTITSADFATLNQKDQIVHLAFFGSGVANSILDFSLDTLVGPLRHVVIKLAGDHPVDLPSGLVIGVGDDLFNTGDYTMYAEPGKRILWGLGGNVEFAAVLKAAGPLLSGGTANIDVGALLPQLLPLLGKLQAGSVVGVEAGPNAATPTFETKPVALNTPLRLRATVKSPDLPTVDGKYVDGVIALAGAAAYPMGFVPLGLTAGLSHKDTTTGPNTAKVDDPSCDPKGTVACNTSNLPFQLAATNNGMEGNPYGVVLLALNFGGLTPGATTGIAVSGIVKLQSEIKYTPTDATPPIIDFGTRAFMSLPNSKMITFSKATRKLVVNSDADASTQIYRFELENGSRLNWNVWMDKAGASGRTVFLIDPKTVDATLVDPLADKPTGRMVGIVTSDPSQNYAKLTGFGDITLDNIGNSLQAFSVIAITLQ